jgi:inner membrane protein
VDPLAHTLAGALLAKSRLGRAMPLAMPTLVLAANVPDVDVFAYVRGGDAALAFRRGITHGPLGLLLLPALVAVVVWLVGRRRWARSPAAGVPAAASAPVDAAPRVASLGGLLSLAYLGALTHPALDWLNTYGVRFLHPFDRRWFYGDTLFIVDPWMWLVPGAAVFLSHRATRRSLAAWAAVAAVATAILVAGADSTAAKALWVAGLLTVAVVRAAGRPRTERGRRGIVAAALGIGAIYLAASVAAAAASRSVVAGSLREDPRTERFERLLVGPLPVTLTRREVVVATPLEIRYGRFHWLDRPRLEWSDWSRPRPQPSPVLEAALRDPSIQGFLGWARFLFVEIDEHPDYHEVHLMDARYTLERGAPFGSAVVRVPRERATTSER